MPTYDWRCHVCRALNRAGTNTCHTCGFAAVASARDIDAAVTGQKIETPLNRDEAERQLRDQLAALPLWKKPFIYLLRGLQYAGWGIFGIALWNLSGDGMLIGFATVVVATLIFALLIGRHDPVA